PSCSISAWRSCHTWPRPASRSELELAWIAVACDHEAGLGDQLGVDRLDLIEVGRVASRRAGLVVGRACLGALLEDVAEFFDEIIQLALLEQRHTGRSEFRIAGHHRRA